MTFEFDGTAVPFARGMTVAGALWARGQRVWHVTERRRQTRGYYCGVGFCYDCLVVVDGRSNTRACQTLAQSGMQVSTQVGFGPP